jgi:hypothetical protein
VWDAPAKLDYYAPFLFTHVNSTCSGFRRATCECLQIFPLADVPAAFKVSMGGKVQGKLGISVP